MDENNIYQNQENIPPVNEQPEDPNTNEKPEVSKESATPYYNASAAVAHEGTAENGEKFATAYYYHPDAYTMQNPSPYQNTQSSAPETPAQQNYTPPVVTPVPTKNKKHGLMIALIIVSSLLIFTIVVGLVGVIYLTNRDILDGNHPTAQSGNEIVLGDGKENNATPNVDVIEQSKDDSKKMDIEQVVAKTLPQVVGVVATTGEGFYASEGEGSGIVLSSDGYIITNAHVIEGASAVKIVLPDEKQTSYDAKVVGSDAKTDLAVLKVEATDLNAADIGNSTELSLGETVVAIGNPYGLELQSSVTSGIVSALDRSVTTSNGKMNLIQTDAAINPGNSGGALVNLYGQVVGICSSKISDLDAEGLGFAIPISDAIPIVKELITQGYISGRPMIGIQGQDINAQTAMLRGVPMGVYVVYVEENSAAYKAGLREYDIITKFNGKTVTCFADLDAAKDECKAGDTVSIEFYRYTNRQTYTVDITLSASGQQ